MITPKDMQKQADSITNIYSDLEDRIFRLIIYILQSSHFEQIDQDNVLLWQMEQLNKMGVLNRKVKKLLAQTMGTTSEEIERLIKVNGLKIVDEIDEELKRMQHRSIPVSSDIDQLLEAFMDQTFLDLNNNVNQTLITTNYKENRVMRAYQSIVKQSTIDAMVGLKTHQQAVKDNVYKWVDKGISSSFIDKGGHEWSLEAYSRMVIGTTAHRTFNELRMQRMEDFDCVTVLMSSHAAARPACAGIQGKVVNRVPMTDRRADSRYDSLYNHGYGEPDGTQGINCRHMLYPFIPGANTNNQPQIDPEEAVKNAEIQQQQRKLERDIRLQKKRLKAAEELDDPLMTNRCKEVIRAKQGKIRELLNKHDFLVRDYSREQVHS